MDKTKIFQGKFYFYFLFGKLLRYGKNDNLLYSNDIAFCFRKLC